MKRILSLVLVLALVLGSVPVAFAAEESAGDMLKTAGFVAGDQDGNLNEDQPLTREQMMVLIAEMNGVKEEAATFGIPADFSDVSEDDWFAPYVWYAFYQGWTAGMGDGSFGAGVAVDSKMASTFMLKALGYEVADYNTSVEEAAEVGIVVEESAAMTRGEGFTAMWSTVNLPKKGSEVALGVELGKLEEKEEPMAEMTAELDAVEAIGNALVEVTFDDDVDAAAAEAAAYVITVKGGTTELAVKDAMSVDTDRVFLETEAMTSGTSYTLTLGEKAINFTGLAKDSDKPAVDSIKGTDTNEVEVVFDIAVDKATAEDIANYSIDKVGTVVAASLDSDNKTVVLTTEGFDKPQAAKMTVENVLSVDGVAMAKKTKTFYTVIDDSAPDLIEVKNSNANNVEVFLYFSDQHGVDEMTAEDISNYSIEGLDILKAEASKKNEANETTTFFEKVTLTTSEQEDGKKYTVKVLNMIDGSTSKNAISEEETDTFYGGDPDEDAPKVTDAAVLSLTEVSVTFDEDNYLDPASALDVSNYSFAKDELTVLDAQFKDDDDEELVIYLTVSKMDSDESYRLEVTNVADTYGNAMEDTDKETIDSGDVVTNAPTYISEVEIVDDENLKVTFAQPVTSATAEDPTNYSIDEGIGAALEASFATGSDTVVELKFAEFSNNESYKLTVNGVETFSGYATEDAAYNFIYTSDKLDTTQPEVEDVDNHEQGIIKVEFSEGMMYTAGSTAVVKKEGTNTTYSVSAVAVAGDDDEIVVFNAFALGTGGSTVVASGKDFTLESFSAGITDKAGNEIKYTAGDEEFDTKSSYPSAGIALEYADVDQDDVNTMTVVYDDEVKLLGSTTTVAVYAYENKAAYEAASSFGASNDGTDNATLDIDGDEVTLDFSGESPFKDDYYVVFKLNGVLGDYAARAVKDQVLIVSSWDDSDDSEPEIDDVRAINDRQIEVVYSEDLSKTGTYEIFDEDDKEISILNTEMGDEDNIVLITLGTSESMESNEYYTLKQKSTAEDLSGNDAEEVTDGIDFTGNSQPFVKEQIDGVVLVNGNKLTIKDNANLPTGTYTVYSGTASGTKLVELSYTAKDGSTAQTATTTTTTGLSGSVDITTSAKEVTLSLTEFYTMVEGQNFTVVIDVTGTDANYTSDFSETFAGIVDELTFGDDSSAASNKLEVVGLDEDTDQTVSVFVNGTKTSPTSQDDEDLTITLSTNDVVKVIVEKDGIIIQASDVYQVK